MILVLRCSHLHRCRIRISKCPHHFASPDPTSYSLRKPWVAFTNFLVRSQLFPVCVEAQFSPQNLFELFECAELSSNTLTGKWIVYLCLELLSKKETNLSVRFQTVVITHLLRSYAHAHPQPFLHVGMPPLIPAPSKGRLFKKSRRSGACQMVACKLIFRIKREFF